jgi:hypothetical protein
VMSSNFFEDENFPLLLDLCVTIGLIILLAVVNRLTELVVLEIALNLHIKKQSSYKPFQGLRLKECELALLCCFPLKNYDAGRKRLERFPCLLHCHCVSDAASPLHISIKITRINWLITLKCNGRLCIWLAVGT